jgi:hypothetical protein
MVCVDNKSVGSMMRRIGYAQSRAEKRGFGQTANAISYFKNELDGYKAQPERLGNCLELSLSSYYAHSLANIVLQETKEKRAAVTDTSGLKSDWFANIKFAAGIIATTAACYGLLRLMDPLMDSRIDLYTTGFGALVLAWAGGVAGMRRITSTVRQKIFLQGEKIRERIYEAAQEVGVLTAHWPHT